jgi:5-methylcytosine-specific restriction protein A
MSCLPMTSSISQRGAQDSNWARGPWAAVFNRLVTDSAQRGFYPVYLFAEDMSGLYLSLNQAMTEAKERYRSDAKTALRGRAENFRAMLARHRSKAIDDLSKIHQ